MLVLQRNPGEAVRIGPDIEVRVLAVGRGQVKLGVSAPREVEIFRSELEQSNRRALVDDWRRADLADLARRLKARK